MRRIGFILGLLLLVSSTGCVLRRMTVMSDPPGARLFVNNVEVGTTPCNVPTNSFIDYGNYKFTLFKDGFEPLEVLQPVPAPWYLLPGLDVFSELGPWTTRDHRTFTYQLQPAKEKSGDELKQQADEFRQRGSGIVTTPPMTTTQPPPMTTSPGTVSPPPGGSGTTIPLPPSGP